MEKGLTFTEALAVMVAGGRVRRKGHDWLLLIWGDIIVTAPPMLGITEVPKQWIPKVETLLATDFEEYVV